MKRIIYLIVILLILTGCQPEVTTLPDASKKPGEIYPKSESPVPIVGDYVVTGQLSYVVADVEQVKYITIKGDDYEAKHNYINVKIGILNSSRKPILIKPEMIRLVDNKGNTYLPDVKLDRMLNNKGKGLFHQEIEPRHKQNAVILFDTSLPLDQAYIEVSGGALSYQTAQIRLLK